MTPTDIHALESERKSSDAPAHWRRYQRSRPAAHCREYELHIHPTHDMHGTPVWEAHLANWGGVSTVASGRVHAAVIAEAFAALADAIVQPGIRVRVNITSDPECTRGKTLVAYEGGAA